MKSKLLALIILLYISAFLFRQINYAGEADTTVKHSLCYNLDNELDLKCFMEINFKDLPLIKATRRNPFMPDSYEYLISRNFPTQKSPVVRACFQNVKYYLAIGTSDPKNKAGKPYLLRTYDKVFVCHGYKIGQYICDSLQNLLIRKYRNDNLYCLPPDNKWGACIIDNRIEYFEKVDYNGLLIDSVMESNAGKNTNTFKYIKPITIENFQL